MTTLKYFSLFARACITFLSTFRRVDSSSFGVAVTVAFMGAPVILSEKLVAGTETTLCLTTMQQILATGVCEAGDGKKEVEGVSLTTRTQSSGDKIWLPDCKKLPKVELNDSSIPLVRWYYTEIYKYFCRIFAKLSVLSKLNFSAGCLNEF